MTPSVGHLLSRLRGRSAPEWRDRLLERLYITGERLGLLDDGELRDRDLRRALAPALRSGPGRSAIQGAAGWREVERPGIPGWEALPDTVARIRAEAGERVAEIVRTADEIVAGRFRLLGFPPIDLPDPIDWATDAVRGVRAPDRHWSRIAFLDPLVVGDHKWTWELSRHQFLVTLAQAYALTGEERYAQRVALLLTSWLDGNPPKRGINWASSLEVSYRAIAWLWTSRLLGHSPAITEALAVRWLKALAVSGRHLARYLSTWFSPNTHLTGEALGLLYLGSELPLLAAAPRWRELGWRILREQLGRQVRADGTYFEQATYYHRYTLDIYLHARLLAATHGLPGVDEVDAALHKLAQVLRWVQRGDGRIPLFGDEDGGRLLFLDGRDGDDVRSPLSTVGILLRDAELVRAGGVPSDEVTWLLGAHWTAPAAAPDGSGTAERARAFDQGGLFVMRDGWGRDDAVCTIDCGPLGVLGGGHGHADTLALDLALGTQPVFIDAGTVSYTTRPAERDAMRHSLVHNTLTLDGTSSSLPAGPFRWSRMTEGVTDVWLVTPDGALFEGHHDGYRALATPARHRRLVAAVRGAWWLVRDVVEGTGEHDAVVTFQAAPGLDLTADADLLRVTDDGRAVLVMRALCDVPGTWVVDDGVVSRRYGARDVARRARYAFRTRGHTAVTFVLLRGTGADWTVHAERAGAGTAVRVACREVEDTLAFGCRDVVMGVRTDARIAWLRRRGDGTTASVVTVGGTMVELDGTRVAVSSPLDVD